MSASQQRYSFLSFRGSSQTDDCPPFQYYGVATTTILFYDYLLTLADEVGRDHTFGISRRFSNETTFVEDRIFLVQKEIVECVRELEYDLPPADLCAAFWLFIAVSPVSSF